MTINPRKTYLQMIFARPISDSVRAFHDRLCQTHWLRYQIFANQLGKLLERFPAFSEFYTDHGRGHSYRIIDNLARLIPEKHFRKLASSEIFLLACAAWGHDVGMVVNRKIIIPNRDDPRTRETWFQEIGLIKESSTSEKQLAAD